MWAFRHHSDYNSESESVSDSCLISESSSQGAVFGIECRVSSWQNSARFVFRGCVFVLCFPRIAIWAVKNKGSNPGEVVPLSWSMKESKQSISHCTVSDASTVNQLGYSYLNRHVCYLIMTIYFRIFMRSFRGIS